MYIPVYIHIPYILPNIKYIYIIYHILPNDCLLTFHNSSFVFWGSGVGDPNLKLGVLGDMYLFIQSCHLPYECQFLSSFSRGV